MKRFRTRAGIALARASALYLALISAGLVQPVQAADYYWASGLYAGSSTDFADAANWSPNGVPGDDDKVIINDGKHLDVSGTQRIGALEFSIARLSGVGHLVVAGPSFWEGGGFFGTGTITFNGDLAVLSSHQGAHEIGGGRTVVLNAVTTWNSAMNTGDTDIMLGANSIQNDSSLIRNNGTFIDVANGSVNNFRFTKRLESWNYSGSHLFENFGTYVKNGGATTQVSSAFDNSGVVRVMAGRLSLYGGGHHSGTFTVGSGAQLEFRGSTSFSGSVIEGDGIVRLSGGSASFSGISRVSSASLVLASATTVDVLENGTLEVRNLNQSGGTLQSDGNVVVKEQALWSAGTILGQGNVQFDGDLSIEAQQSGGARKVVGPMTTLVLNGTTTWSSGFSLVGTIENHGAFLEGDANLLALEGAQGRFINFGTYVKRDGFVTTIASVFDNRGSTRIEAGSRLLLSGGGAHSGMFTIESGAVLDLFDGSHILDGSTFAGPGTVRISAGYTGFEGDFIRHQGRTDIEGGIVSIGSGTTLETAALRQSGGVLNIAGVVRVSESASWTNGTIDGAGELRVDGNLDLSNAGSSRRLAGGARILLNGETTWNSAASHAEVIVLGARNGDRATLVNSGRFLDHTDRDNFKRISVDNFYSAGPSGRFEFVNFGTYVKTGAGWTSIETTLDNYGHMEVAEGRLSFRGEALNHGLITGSGSIGFAQALINLGDINPGNTVGELNLSGSVHFGDDSFLTIELAAPDSFDALAIDFEAIFGGTLRIVSVDGFNPEDGDSFVVSTFGWRNDSEFAELSWSGFDERVSFDVVYGDSDVRLVAALAPVPEPGAYALFLSGLGLLAFASRRRRALCM